MEFDNQRVSHLYRIYLDASASQAEEQTLREILASTPRHRLTPELRIAAVMLCGFEAIGHEQMPQSRTTRRTPIRRTIIATICAGVAAAVAIGIFWAAQTTVYGYINGEKLTDLTQARAQMSYLEGLETLGESFMTAEKIIEN